MTLPRTLSKKTILGSLTILLTAVACAPHHSPQPASITGISTLSKEQSSCEKQLRAQMLAGGVLLSTATAAKDDIDQAMTAVLASQAKMQIKYQLGLVNEKLSDASVSFETNDDAQSVSLSYDLNLGGQYSTLFSFKTEYTAIKADTAATQITQTFTVSDSCELTLTHTSVETIRSLGAGAYSDSVRNDYIDGKNDSEQKRFQLAKGQRLANLMSNVSSVTALKANTVIYISGLGLVDVTLENLAGDKVVSQFGRQFQFDRQTNMTLSANQKIFAQITSYENSSSPIKLQEQNKTQTWTVPKDLWERQSLGIERLTDDGQLKYDLAKDYLRTHDSIVLRTSEVPQYDHFAVYWNVLSEQTGADGVHTLTLRENSKATAKSASSTAEDLESNDTVQTKLPQIQAIAKAISAKEPADRQRVDPQDRERVDPQERKRVDPQDRERQVSLILSYLADHYKYDYDMLNNNIVRTLTTADALKAGKGVCQHYALIFTAIARALKIPTRIVIGLLMADSKPGYHAWVEVEMKPGLWRAVEPQYKNLQDMHTRFYLPLIRGSVIERKNDANQTLNTYQAIMNFEASISPAP